MVGKLLFDFVAEDGNIERKVFENPIKIVTTTSLQEVRKALDEVQQAVNRGYYAAGYVSYEAAPAFDPAYLVAQHLQMPLLWFGIYEKPTVKEEVCAQASFKIGKWQADTDRKRYNKTIQSIKRAIASGETYQVNYTMRLYTDFYGDDLAYYEHLRLAQRAKYSAYMDLGRFRILSLSPELFFQGKQNQISTRPMKGTIARAKQYEDDQKMAMILSTSEKDQAENVMIVDLIRNDLAKIPGVQTVHVPQIFSIERFPTVYQMTSTIEANYAMKPTLLQVFDALFPCGSITGAPKVSTMKIIAQVEQSSRDVYCGAIGYVEPEGETTFNVAIRTIWLDSMSGKACYGVGGGITWDSTEEGEYEEAMMKTRFLHKESVEFSLLETLKWEDGQFFLLERHLHRMQQSAMYFDFRFDRSKIMQSLEEHANLYVGQTRRVRLLLASSGSCQVESTPLLQTSRTEQVVALAKTPIDQEDIFLYHKTTHREVYAYHKKENPEVYDILLWNEQGQITEFTTGNIVVEISGQKWTPSRPCGLLNGTYREQLVEQGILEEKIITIEEVLGATKVWLMNSVRGFVPVRIC
nr:aminodeoxychorismate synthase component I [Bacilli bacterium]